MKKIALLLVCMMTFFMHATAQTDEQKHDMVLTFKLGPTTQRIPAESIDKLTFLTNSVLSEDTLMVINFNDGREPQLVYVNTLSTLHFEDAQSETPENVLQSLVLRPQTTYGGYGAVRVTTLSTKYFTNMLGLTSYIDDYARRNEVLGTKGWVGASKELTVDYEESGKNISDHDRYTLSSGDLTFTLSGSANYTVNPSDAFFGDDTEVRVISDNISVTRSVGNAVVALDGAASGPEHLWTFDDGVLSVPLTLTGTVGSTETSPAGLTLFATQVVNNGTIVTSDYSAIVQSSIKDIRLSHAKYNPNGKTSSDFINTGLFNSHCGECALYTSGSKLMGMHLFGSIGEVAYFVENYGSGKGQDVVDYLSDIDLNMLVETHCTNDLGLHVKMSEDVFNRFFEYRFEITGYRHGSNNSSESIWAAIYQDELGHWYLHPQDTPDGVHGAPYSETKASSLAIGHTPVVRVSIVTKADGNVIDYGYLPITITGKPQPIKEPDPFTLQYTSSKDITLNVYGGAYYVGGSSFSVINTTSYQLEADLAAYGIDKQTFSQYYTPDYSTSGSNMDLDQFYITNESAFMADPENVSPIFYPVRNTPLSQAKIGTIHYDIDDYGGSYSQFSPLGWNIYALEARALANAGVAYLCRAVCFKSSDVSKFPDIYIIFKTGKISLEEKTVTANMNVTAKRINEYWYAFGNASATGFALGTDEIHFNVYTPEQADQSGMGDGNYKIWKPYSFNSKLRNVFVRNFDSGDFSSWMTFTGAPTGSPFTRNNVKLALLFDDSNNGRQFKGKLDSGAAKAFTISNTTAADATKKNLYATYNGTTQLVASIIEPAGLWDGTDVDKLGAAHVELAKTAFAKALLNYVSKDFIGGDDVLNVTVAVLPISQKATANPVVAPQSQYYSENVPQAIISGDGVASGAVKYLDGSVVRYADLKIEDYKFNVRFIRPLSMYALSDVILSSTDYEAQIDLHELLSGFTDWRGGLYDGSVWKTTPDYEEFYAPEGKNRFDVSVLNVPVGDYVSSNPSVRTNLNQSNPSIFVPLNMVTSSIDFQVLGDGKIEFRNGASIVSDFKVIIPVAIDYYWGTFYENLTINIVRTSLNN